MAITSSLWRCLNLQTIRTTRAEARHTLVVMLLEIFFFFKEIDPAAAARAPVLPPVTVRATAGFISVRKCRALGVYETTPIIKNWMDDFSALEQ